VCFNLFGFRSLGQHGLFAIFEYTLADEDIDIRLAASSMLSSILDHDPTLVRSFCLAQVHFFLFLFCFYHSLILM
jgi:hypothetical protein